MLTKAPKGTRDILPKEAYKHRKEICRFMQQIQLFRNENTGV